MSILSSLGKIEDRINPFDNRGGTPRPKALQTSLPLYRRDQTSQRFSPPADKPLPYRAFTMPIWKNGANEIPQNIGFKPMDSVTQKLANTSASTFQWTPAFKAVIDAAQPGLPPAPKLESRGLRGVPAVGTYQYADGDTGHPWKPFNQYEDNQAIRINPHYQDSTVLTHEGLHSAFETNPQSRADFAKAYNSSMTPELAAWLAKRTQMYEATQTPAAFMKFENLNPSMQTEAHSYFSEYPTDTKKALPPGLTKYYSRYINPNNAGRGVAKEQVKLLQKVRVQQSIQDALDRYKYNSPQYWADR